MEKKKKGNKKQIIHCSYFPFSQTSNASKSEW